MECADKDETVAGGSSAGRPLDGGTLLCWLRAKLAVH